MWTSLCIMMTGKGRGATLVTIVVAVLAVSLVSAQITFSRDWTGGKRAAPAPLAVDCSQFARLCRHFLHELKTSMHNVLPDSPKRRRVHEDAATIYEDD